jgi:hypothetical protein
MRPPPGMRPPACSMGINCGAPGRICRFFILYFVRWLSFFQNDADIVADVCCVCVCHPLFYLRRRAAVALFIAAVGLGFIFDTCAITRFFVATVLAFFKRVCCPLVRTSSPPLSLTFAVFFTMPPLWSLGISLLITLTPGTWSMTLLAPFQPIGKPRMNPFPKSFSHVIIFVGWCWLLLSVLISPPIIKMNTSYGDEPLSAEDSMPYQFTQQSYVKPDERTDVGGYEYDADLSNENTAVYHNKDTRQTHVSNRGTVTAYDGFVSDSAIALGREGASKRFQTAISLTKKAHEKYNYDVSTSGHSLGGSLAEYSTSVLGNESWYKAGTSFNAGSSPIGRDAFWSQQRSECASANPPAYCGKMTNIKKAGDPISQNSSAFGNTKTYHAKRSMFTKAARMFSPTYRVYNNFGQHYMSNFNITQN